MNHQPQRLALPLASRFQARVWDGRKLCLQAVLILCALVVIPRSAVSQAAADLSVSATIAPDPIPPTSNGQCQLSVTNLGPSAASNVVLSNVLSGVKFLSVQAGATTWTNVADTIIFFIGSLPAGQARTVAFTFHPRQISLLTNVLIARSDVFDPVPQNNRALVVARAGPALVITQQPQDVQVAVGGSATFFVTAQGYGSLTYQWFADGTAIAGATSSTLTLTGVQASAKIQVQVSDALGSILSQPASLNAVKPPSIIASPQPLPPVPTNTAAQFFVGADGTAPLLYQWRLNGANIPGATNRDYLITNAQRPDGGSYTVAIANDAGVTVTEPVSLTFPDFPSVDGSDFLAQAPLLPPAGIGGIDPFHGIIRSDNTNATKDPGEPNHADQPGGASVWYLWRAPAPGIATFETVGSTFDTLLAVYTNLTSVTGLSYTNLAEVASDDDRGGYFRSRLQFNAIEGQFYAVVVDGFAGRQGFFLLGWNLEQATLPLPVFTVHPRSRSVPQGASLMLRSEAAGGTANNPLFFQWLFNGTPIQGANGSNYIISAVTAKEVGAYSVVAGGSSTAPRFVESRPAVVEIGPVPAIQSQDKLEDVLVNRGGATPNSGLKTMMMESGSLGGPPFVSVAFGIPGTQVMNNTNSTADIDCFRIGTATRWLGIHVTNDPAAAGSLLQVDTAGSAIMTELAVYRFLYPSCLQSVPCMHTNIMGCDTNGGAGDSYSIVQFAPQLDGDYLVFADGLSGAQGVIQMNWQLGTPPMLDPPSPDCASVFGAGTNVTLTAGLTNKPVPPPAYQWYGWGMPLANATNDTLNFTPIQSTNAGSYSVVVSNLFGVVTNLCCVIVTPPQLHCQAALTSPPWLFTLGAALWSGCVLQVTTNLTPPVAWQDLVTNMAANCSFQYAVPMQDTNGLPLPQRFYRMRAP